MATPEQDAFDALVGRAPGATGPATWSSPGDLGRMSREAMVASRDDAREIRSEGVVRLTGAGVTGHAADLDQVGLVATLWQRCVWSIGAALEGTRTSVGRIPDSVRLRTQLQLNAGAAPGSLILDLAPKANPFEEVAPTGSRPMFDAPRPLADRSSEALLNLLQAAVDAGPVSDSLAARFRELGPRVATSVAALAGVLDSAHFDLAASWSEPERPTVRSNVSAGEMSWLRDFVSGRALDAVEQEIAGTVRTVSDVAKWAIETMEGVIYVSAIDLPPEEIRSTTVGQQVRMIVFVRVTERPDGSTTTTRDAVRLVRE